MHPLVSERKWRRREIVPIVVLYMFLGCFRIIKPSEESCFWLARVWRS